jgi:two-component system sensor histidine kinase CpxA
VDSAHAEKVDIKELLEELVEDAQFEASAMGCRIELRDTFSAAVWANPGLLHSAIENVVRNAIKYTKPATAVEISMLANTTCRDGIVVQVRDHGPGAPEDMLPHLFQPFVRLEEARDRSTGGHGLGLAIADRAVRLHGGKIVARNESDEGLSIQIHLPSMRSDENLNQGNGSNLLYGRE